MYKMNKVMAIVICLAIVCSVIPVGMISYAADFTPRTTAPSSSNRYYYADNVFYQSGYGIPNCTAYAYGRAYELLGHKPSLSTGNAGKWYNYNANNGFYPYGSEPRLGAIACWDKYDSNKGHVAVVEGISGDNITISESHYGGTSFDIRTIKKDSSNYLTSMRFLGYIYIGNFGSSSTTPIPTQPTARVISNADHIDGGKGSISVRGWNYDALAPSSQTYVVAYIDGPIGAGAEVARIATNCDRPDVNTSYNITGFHGFEATFPVTQRGSHTVYLYGMDVNFSNPTLFATKQVNIEEPETIPAPTHPTERIISNADHIDGGKGSISVKGWTYDSFSPSSQTYVVVYIDGAIGTGSEVARIATNCDRPDVNAAYNISGFHGFEATVPVPQRGSHKLYLYGMDVNFNNPALFATKQVNIEEPETPVYATGISLSNTSLNITEGNSYTLTANVTPSNAVNKSVTWTSSNTSVATVSGGVVKANKAGTATITAKTVTGFTASCNVTVKAKSISVTGVGLDKSTASLTVGESFTLTAKIYPSDASNKNVKWESSDTTVATVSGGVVKAVDEGEALITVTTADGGIIAWCLVKVIKLRPWIYGFKLDKTSMELTVGETGHLTAYQKLVQFLDIYDATDEVTWTSSNSQVATVNNGKVTAVKAGTATITAKSKNGNNPTATCVVTVSDRLFDTSDKVEYNGHYYRAYDMSVTWDEAKAYCEKLGGHLATITSDGENDFVYKLMRSNNMLNAHLGGTDFGHEGVWEWVTGERWNYTNWNPGEPNNQDEDEHYLLFYERTSDKWNDGNGGATGFICEWEDVNVTPQPGTVGGITIDKTTVKDYTVDSLSVEMIGENVRIMTSVTKNSDRKDEDTIIIAMYKDGALADMLFMETESAQGETVTFSGTMTAVEGAVVKSFVWDGLENMLPLSNSVKFTL